MKELKVNEQIQSSPPTTMPTTTPFYYVDDYITIDATGAYHIGVPPPQPLDTTATK